MSKSTEIKWKAGKVGLMSVLVVSAVTQPPKHQEVDQETLNSLNSQPHTFCLSGPDEAHGSDAQQSREEKAARGAGELLHLVH